MTEDPCPAGRCAPMIVLFTDFGREGPYVGQMRARLLRLAPQVPVIDLFADAPSFDPRLAAYLLSAYVDEFPTGTVFLCVVDPGVGGARPPMALRADDRWFVGPGNGLFELVARRAGRAESWEITWRPDHLSASFHGRDLFAPVAARLALGTGTPGAPRPGDWMRRPDWPDELAQIVYVDHFGNAMTGIRAAALAPRAVLGVGATRLSRARTFSDLPQGQAFWYENANGLAEIAVSRGRADRMLELAPGCPVSVLTEPAEP